MIDDETTPDGPRRGRGTRAGLTAARIVEAARDLDAETITVKAVADRLGVDRAAVHHHVSDVGALRQAVAFEAFTGNFGTLALPPDADWRQACRLLALSMHGAVLAAKGLGVYVRLTAANVALLEPVDRTLRIMTEAGFDDETAARSLAALTSMAGALAREQLIAQQPSGHPQVPELRLALDEAESAHLPALRRFARADLVDFDDTQLQMSIDLLLEGMAARLTNTR